MKYVSLDIETTGTDSEKHQIVEIGAVIDDLKAPNKPIDKLPSFHCYVEHDEYVVSEYVLGLHSDTGIWKKLQNREDHHTYLKPEQVGYHLGRWLFENGMAKHAPEDIGAFHSFMKNFGSGGYPDAKEARLFRDSLPITVTFAGKNFAGFDAQFLKALPNFEDYIRIRHRIIDPGPMYLREDDDGVPNSKTCYERAGIVSEVAHTALEDAKDTVQVVRHGVAMNSV
jgi:oligoribonuclease (3'-5' exoribonuclease)